MTTEKVKTPDSHLLKDDKQMWNELAEENSRYFIWSSKYEQSEEEFRESGRTNFEEFVVNDDFLAEMLADSSVERVLEIGCGTGRMTEFFARNFKHVVGIDIAAEMLTQGAARLADVDNIEWLETDGSSIPLPDSSIDFVFSFIVFQHIPSRSIITSYFREIHRVLKPGGGAKTQLRGKELAKKFEDMWFYGIHFTPEEAERLAADTGFELLKAAGQGQEQYWLWLKK